MGELRKFYSLADVVFVGRTLVDLGPRQHGSDMIEPAALAKPVIVGPYTGNFAEAMIKFREADAVHGGGGRGDADGGRARAALDARAGQGDGHSAQEVVRREQGATARHAEVILERSNPLRRVAIRNSCLCAGVFARGMRVEQIRVRQVSPRRSAAAEARRECALGLVDAGR